jgi:AraC family transcriptional regulator
VAEYVCCSGPDDRPFEEQHENFTIAAVLEGTFTYRCDAGKELMHPGSILLGNFGRCFECGHDHSRGDRCVALHIAPPLFGEIAASVAGTARYRFGVAMLPAAASFAGMLVKLQSSLLTRASSLTGAMVIELTEMVLSEGSGCSAAPAALSSQDLRRVSEAVHYIEDNASEPVDLDQLAGAVNMSKYHFLRVFRQATGMPPYRYLLNLRMWRAAVRLTTSSEPISAIAYDAGFGDLSTFNNRFRVLFGVSPSVYRKQQGNCGRCNATGLST